VDSVHIGHNCCLVTWNHKKLEDRFCTGNSKGRNLNKSSVAEAGCLNLSKNITERELGSTKQRKVPRYSQHQALVGCTPLLSLPQISANVPYQRFPYLIQNHISDDCGVRSRGVLRQRLRCVVVAASLLTTCAISITR